MGAVTKKGITITDKLITILITEIYISINLDLYFKYKNLRKPFIYLLYTKIF